LSKVVGNKFYAAIEDVEKCGKVDELRPYGRNGANICFSCGMKDLKTTERMFEERIEGVEEVILVNDYLN
jgi:hypothetical protein